MSDPLVTEARRLLAEATPGITELDWYHILRFFSKHYPGSWCGDFDGPDPPNHQRDSKWIAAAPTLLAQLADEVEQLQKRLDTTADMYEGASKLLDVVAYAATPPSDEREPRDG